MTPERRLELYNKPSSQLTNAELLEYIEGSRNMVPAQHIMSLFIQRFKAMDIVRRQEVMMAFEVGYRAAEKGQNLLAAQMEMFGS